MVRALWRAMVRAAWMGVMKVARQEIAREGTALLWAPKDAGTTAGLREPATAPPHPAVHWGLPQAAARAKPPQTATMEAMYLRTSAARR